MKRAILPAILQGGQPESFSHIDMPSIDTAVWDKTLSLGLDPVEVLLSSGLTRDKVRLVLQASGLTAYCNQVQGDSNSSSNRSSEDGSVGRNVDISPLEAEGGDARMRAVRLLSSAKAEGNKGEAMTSSANSNLASDAFSGNSRGVILFPHNSPSNSSSKIGRYPGQVSTELQPSRRASSTGLPSNKLGESSFGSFVRAKRLSSESGVPMLLSPGGASLPEIASGGSAASNGGIVANQNLMPHPPSALIPRQSSLMTGMAAGSLVVDGALQSKQPVRSSPRPQRVSAPRELQAQPTSRPPRPRASVSGSILSSLSTTMPSPLQSPRSIFSPLSQMSAATYFPGLDRQSDPLPWLMTRHSEPSSRPTAQPQQASSPFNVTPDDGTHSEGSAGRAKLGAWLASTESSVVINARRSIRRSSTDGVLPSSSAPFGGRIRACSLPGSADDSGCVEPSLDACRDLHPSFQSYLARVEARARLSSVSGSACEPQAAPKRKSLLGRRSSGSGDLFIMTHGA